MSKGIAVIDVGTTGVRVLVAKVSEGRAPQIIAKADGYKSLTQYIRVGQASAGLDVVLDKVDSEIKLAYLLTKRM